MSFLLSSSCAGQRSSQLSGCWNQCKVSASRVPLKSQFELVLSCSVLKELVVISRESSTSTCADAFVGSWSALSFLDGNSDKRAINAMFSESELFSGPEPACSGSALVSAKNFFVFFEFLFLTISAKEFPKREWNSGSRVWESCGSSTSATDHDNAQCSDIVKVFSLELHSLVEISGHLGPAPRDLEVVRRVSRRESISKILIRDVPESHVERSLPIQTHWVGLVLKLYVVSILCP